jgi:hypothetical protein
MLNRQPVLAMLLIEGCDNIFGKDGCHIRARRPVFKRPSGLSRQVSHRADAVRRAKLLFPQAIRQRKARQNTRSACRAARPRASATPEITKDTVRGIASAEAGTVGRRRGQAPMPASCTSTTAFSPARPAKRPVGALPPRRGRADASGTLQRKAKPSSAERHRAPPGVAEARATHRGAIS